ncbi:MAG: hypothetical protein D6689_13820 [Deltaproteobacteria bacterium]|nr:MAG: hypothetical protein D6689_13820 [Deltaproteobacteria bacterium]
MRTASIALAGTLSVVPACTSSSSGSEDLADAGGPDAAAPASDAAPAADADVAGFTDLIVGQWTIPAGTEQYRCVYKTIERTIYVRAFRPKIPLGTHHTVLTVGPRQRDDGIVPCNAGTNYGAQVFGSGVGTNALVLPDGVAVKLEAGDQLLLNLHLFNFSESDLSGESGTEIIETDPAEVEHVAEAFMVSKFDLAIPPGAQTQAGDCTLSQDTTLLSVAPHMHMLGTRMKVVARSSLAGDVVLLDEPYNFDNQTVRVLPQPVPMAAGDRIHIECTYNNTTGSLVTFGDSSLEEMCISGHFRYPATGGGLFCATGL